LRNGHASVDCQQFPEVLFRKSIWLEKQSGINLPDLEQGWQKDFEFIMQLVA